MRRRHAGRLEPWQFGALRAVGAAAELLVPVDVGVDVVEVVRHVNDAVVAEARLLDVLEAEGRQVVGPLGEGVEAAAHDVNAVDLAVHRAVAPGDLARLGRVPEDLGLTRDSAPSRAGAPRRAGPETP
jgi:hypothetical protein